VSAATGYLTPSLSGFEIAVAPNRLIIPTRRPTGGICPRIVRTDAMAAHDLTALLIDWRGGDQSALDRLVPLVHDELRRMAHRHMASERPGHVLQSTALVNEVYLRLIDVQRVQWQDRAHFYAMVARLMRRVLIDFARAQKNKKRGGELQRVTFDRDLPVAVATADDLVAIDEALDAFSRQHERKAQVVELRFFGGLSVEETAEALNISPETVMRDWKFAKSWLLRELTRSKPAGA
jgi:RNA polymerase sigma-70 factor, ECF subfamily